MKESTNSYILFEAAPPFAATCRLVRARLQFEASELRSSFLPWFSSLKALASTLLWLYVDVYVSLSMFFVAPLLLFHLYRHRCRCCCRCCVHKWKFGAQALGPGAALLNFNVNVNIHTHSHSLTYPHSHTDTQPLVAKECKRAAAAAAVDPLDGTSRRLVNKFPSRSSHNLSRSHSHNLSHRHSQSHIPWQPENAVI